MHGRGPQQKSTFLLWTGVLKGGLGCIRGVVLGHLARTKILGLPERFRVARLLEDIVELVYMGILCLSFGAWFTLCRAAVWPRLVAKLSERGFLFARIERWMIRRISGRDLEMGAVVLVGDGLVAVETLGGGIVAEAPRESSSSSSSSSSPSRRKRRGKQQKVKEAQKLLEKHDPQCQQWKEEAKKKERAVELQEQAEVLAKVMKEQFDHTINALSPALVSSPSFPPSPLGVPSLPLAVEERSGVVAEGVLCSEWGHWR